MNGSLSFRDVEILARQIHHRGLDSKVDRVFVPRCDDHPNRYFKQEWCIEFRSGAQLYFCIRPRMGLACVFPTRRLGPAPQATRSGFDLGLSKHLVGKKLQSIRAIENERILEFTFEDQLRLILVLIPARPEATLLVEEDGESRFISTRLSTQASAGYAEVVGRNLTPEERARYAPQPWLASYLDDPVRGESKILDTVLDLRRAAALLLRKQRISGMIREKIRHWEKQLPKNESREEKQNWEKFGEIFQIHFHSKPKPVDGFFELIDLTTGNLVYLPAKVGLNPSEQLQYYFHQAKRAKTRAVEHRERTDRAQQQLLHWKKKQEILEQLNDSSDLIAFEATIGLSKKATVSRESQRVLGFSGRVYQSTEGMLILCGRNSKENQELTFKIAKGNDVWLHVRGRPGAHTVILIPPGKTASLETLLDAAHLCVLYSKGKDWGKTEVDYTYRKYVKKIKGQTEVTYTQNKTLSISFDEPRIQKLEAQTSS